MVVISKWAPVLTLAGVIPFALPALLYLLGISQLPLLGALQPVVASYGLVILSFMAGVHWGQVIHKPSWHLLLIISNVITLGGWFAFLAGNATLLWCVLILGFVALLLVDQRLLVAGVITPAYWRLRMAVTAIVVIALLIFLLR
jgi:hypothetical protein